jgi:hypothetical protein
MFKFSNNRRSKKDSPRNRRAKRQRKFESLEQRTMFAVSSTVYEIPEDEGGGQALFIYSDDKSDIVSLVETEYGPYLNAEFAPGQEVKSFRPGQIKKVVFFGRGGNDTFFNGTDIPMYAEGGGGHDKIWGGRGNDVIWGGNGTGGKGDGNVDILFGGAGNDAINGEGGDDRISGGEGIDALFGSSGNDLIYGGDDMDFIFGGAEADTLIGGKGGDFLSGGHLAIDTLYGGNDPNIVGSDLEERMWFGFDPTTPDPMEGWTNHSFPDTAVDYFHLPDHPWGGNSEDVVMSRSKNDRIFKASLHVEDEFRATGRIQGVQYAHPDGALDMESLISFERGFARTGNARRWDDVFNEPTPPRIVSIRVGEASMRSKATGMIGGMGGFEFRPAGNHSQLSEVAKLGVGRLTESPSRALNPALADSVFNQYARIKPGIETGPSVSVLPQLTTPAISPAAVLPNVTTQVTANAPARLAAILPLETRATGNDTVSISPPPSIVSTVMSAATRLSQSVGRGFGRSGDNWLG